MRNSWILNLVAEKLLEKKLKLLEQSKENIFVTFWMYIMITYVFILWWSKSRSKFCRKRVKHKKLEKMSSLKFLYNSNLSHRKKDLKLKMTLYLLKYKKRCQIGLQKFIHSKNHLRYDKKKEKIAYKIFLHKRFQKSNSNWNWRANFSSQWTLGEKLCKQYNFLKN